MKFSYTHRVAGHETDINGVVPVSSIMRYAQEGANLQHLFYGPTTDELRRDGTAFILSRVALDMNESIRAQEEITITTWLNEARGFGYTRYTEISKNGVICAKMTAFWGAMEISARRPLRVESISLGFGTDGDTLEVTSPIRFKNRDAVYEKIGSHTVLYGDCDENLHLNNTNYPIIFCNCLDSMKGKKVTHLSVNFQSEAKLGASFDILCFKNGDEYLFKTVFEDGRTGAEARMVINE